MNQILPRRPVQQLGRDLVGAAGLLGRRGGAHALECGAERRALRPVAFVAGAPPAPLPPPGPDPPPPPPPPAGGEKGGEVEAGEALPGWATPPPPAFFSGHPTPRPRA